MALSSVLILSIIGKSIPSKVWGPIYVSPAKWYPSLPAKYSKHPGQIVTPILLHNLVFPFENSGAFGYDKVHSPVLDKKISHPANFITSSYYKANISLIAHQNSISQTSKSSCPLTNQQGSSHICHQSFWCLYIFHFFLANATDRSFHSLL